MRLSKLRWAVSERLKSVCGEDARFDTDLLIEKAYGIPFGKIALEGDREVDESNLEPLVARRLKGEPTQYILGQWEFFGLPFYVGDGVLIPRPDTEVLVEKGLELIKGTQSPRVLDLCSGSGCIAVAIKKHRPDASVTAVELYDKAAEYLVRNLALNNAEVEVRRADVLKPVKAEEWGKFDLILSNPPYVDGKAMTTLSAEVKAEPHTALFGGEDGLDFYRAIAENWLELLGEKGAVAVEIGFDQGKSVPALFKEKGLNTAVIKDYGGNDRVIIGTQSALI